MKILLVSATQEEILPFLDWAQQHGSDKLQIANLVTGIGFVATTFHLTQVLSQHPFDLCIQAGIAGSFRKNMPLGTVVHIVSEQFADLGSEEADGQVISGFDLGFMEANSFPFENGKITNPAAGSHHFLPTVQAVSSDLSHGSQSSIDRIIKQYDPDIESMEGAAFFYVCRKLEAPFLEIRAISNYVEPRNKSNWNIPLAINNLNDTLIKLVTTFLDAS